MATIPEKVTITSLSGGHPFGHLKQPSMKSGKEGETPFDTRIEVQSDGTKIQVPRTKQGENNDSR